jgi:hypothetical protein
VKENTEERISKPHKTQRTLGKHPTTKQTESPCSDDTNSNNNNGNRSFERERERKTHTYREHKKE